LRPFHLDNLVRVSLRSYKNPDRAGLVPPADNELAKDDTDDRGWREVVMAVVFVGDGVREMRECFIGNGALCELYECEMYALGKWELT
jgi:hypothetical protein